jgi:hypothetical protein
MPYATYSDAAFRPTYRRALNPVGLERIGTARLGVIVDREPVDDSVDMNRILDLETHGLGDVVYFCDNNDDSLGFAGPNFPTARTTSVSASSTPMNSLPQWKYVSSTKEDASAEGLRDVIETTRWREALMSSRIARSLENQTKACLSTLNA